MPRHVAFLRGMNLGARRITNEELAKAFEGLGLTDVATFRASGNVVFGGPEGVEEDDLATRIEAGLADSLGYEVPVFLRSCARSRGDRRERALSGRRHRGCGGKAPGRDAPRRAGRGRAPQGALALAGEEDLLAIEGAELYWLPSGGISESDLDLKTLEAEVGPWTMRTMGTVGQIAAKHCG